MRIPNAENAFVDIRKLSEYTLTPTHRLGKHKARLFAALPGMGVDEAEEFRNVLLQIVRTHDAEVREKDDHGQRYRFRRRLMNDEIKLLDVMALTIDLPQYNLCRGEVGAVVECYPDHTFDVEFVAQDGYTYALATLRSDQLIPLRQKRTPSDPVAVPAAL